MIVALELSDDVDPTALATVALAALTVIALWYTRRALLQARDDFRLSRNQAEQAHRPVLVPVIDGTRRMTLPNDQTAPAIPTPAGNRLFVPVENIGAGPALEVEMVISYRGENVAEAHRGEHLMTSPGIGVGHLASLELPLVAAPSGPFHLYLGYADVAGARGSTTAYFEVGMAARYEDVEFSPPQASSPIVKTSAWTYLTNRLSSLRRHDRG